MIINIELKYKLSKIEPKMVRLGTLRVCTERANNGQGHGSYMIEK